MRRVGDNKSSIIDAGDQRVMDTWNEKTFPPVFFLKGKKMANMKEHKCKTCGISFYKSSPDQENCFICEHVKYKCFVCENKCRPAKKLIEKFSAEPWTAAKALSFLYQICKEEE